MTDAERQASPSSRPCDSCTHRRRDPDRCWHPDVRLVGILANLPEERTCTDWSDAPEVTP